MSDVSLGNVVAGHLQGWIGGSLEGAEDLKRIY